MSSEAKYVDIMDRFYIALHPRPVVLIVTTSRDGRINVMAASWVTPISEDEPSVGIAMDREHYTRKLLDEVGELTINVPTVDLVDEVLKAGTVSGRVVDKTKILNLTFSKSRKVRPPIVNECIAHLECTVSKIVPVGEVDFIIARVVESYSKPEYMYGSSWDLRRARILQHLSGRTFTYAERIIFART